MKLDTLTSHPKPSMILSKISTNDSETSVIPLDSPKNHLEMSSIQQLAAAAPFDTSMKHPKAPTTQLKTPSMKVDSLTSHLKTSIIPSKILTNESKTSII